MVKCVVSGCPNRLEVKGLFNRPQKRFFNLPRDQARVKVWLAALRETDKLRDHNHIICEEHFLPEHITPRGISDDAIPLMPPYLDGPLGSVMATAPSPWGAEEEEEEEEMVEEEEEEAGAAPHAAGDDDSTAQPPLQHQQDDSVERQSVATTDSMEHQSVATTDSMEHQSATTDSIEHQSVAITDSMEHQSATTDSMEHQSVATTDSMEHQSVATTDSMEHQSATTDSMEHQSVATTDSMEHQSVATTDSCDVTFKPPDPQTHQKTLKDNPASRELSLILLTRRLMELLSAAPDGLLDLTQAATRLQACKRRVYDVTSVLGAFKLVKRRAPNKIQWIAESPVSSYLGKSDHAVQEELGNLKVVEETLDVLIKTCAQQLFDMTDDTHNTGSAYVTHEDIRHIPVFQGQTILVVKAPEETKLEVPTPTEDSIQVHLKAGKGPITVLTCEMGRAGEAKPTGSGENAAGCFLHVEESRIQTHPLHTETQQKVVQSA